MFAANPVLVTAERGKHPETMHRGVAVILDSGGKIIRQWGNVNRPIFPRSLIKPLHAVALVMSGAADRYNLGPEQIALAGSSHLGNKEHVALLAEWCGRIGVSEEDLLCGSHRPHDDRVADAMAAQGQRPTPIHNNNSGRHLAALTICRHIDAPIHDYMDYKHPVQRLFRETVELLTSYRCDPSCWAIDVCGMPTTPIPAWALCLGTLRMCSWPERLDVQEAGRRVLCSMADHPDLVLGARKFSSTVIEATAGDLVIKTGAEGGFLAVSRGLQRAALTKIDDGAVRASMGLVIEVLKAGELISTEAYDRIRQRYGEELKAYNGSVTGRLRVHLNDDWP